MKLYGLHGLPTKEDANGEIFCEKWVTKRARDSNDSRERGRDEPKVVPTEMKSAK